MIDISRTLAEKLEVLEKTVRELRRNGHPEGWCAYQLSRHLYLDSWPIDLEFVRSGRKAKDVESQTIADAEHRGRLAERADVVAWLRAPGATGGVGWREAAWAKDIEMGEHEGMGEPDKEAGRE